MKISRSLFSSEIQVCADIWLASSISAHAFIAPDFWKNSYCAMVEQYLPASDIFIVKELDTPIAFIAVHHDTLAALFVLPAWQRKGVGTLLLTYVQALYKELRLTVYSKNKPAINFYLHHGFITQHEQTCSHTHESELLMFWKTPH